MQRRASDIRIGNFEKVEISDFRSDAFCFLAQCRTRLFACVNELDAIALVLKAVGEAEPLPSAILALIIASRQRCEREVAHPTDIRDTQKDLCAGRREGPESACVTTGREDDAISRAHRQAADVL
jgi:hypothetical protein